jgi:hypothetical protein
MSGRLIELKHIFRLKLKKFPSIFFLVGSGSGSRASHFSWAHPVQYGLDPSTSTFWSKTFSTLRRPAFWIQKYYFWSDFSRSSVLVSGSGPGPIGVNIILNLKKIFMLALNISRQPAIISLFPTKLQYLNLAKQSSGILL